MNAKQKIQTYLKLIVIVEEITYQELFFHKALSPFTKISFSLGKKPGFKKHLMQNYFACGRPVCTLNLQWVLHLSETGEN